MKYCTLLFLVLLCGYCSAINGKILASYNNKKAYFHSTITIQTLYNPKSQYRVRIIYNIESLVFVMQQDTGNFPLDLEEIVNILQILARDLPHLFQLYGLYSNLTWEEWFKRYWWAIPLMTTAILIKIIINHQAHVNNDYYISRIVN